MQLFQDATVQSYIVLSPSILTVTRGAVSCSKLKCVPSSLTRFVAEPSLRRLDRGPGASPSHRLLAPGWVRRPCLLQLGY